MNMRRVHVENNLRKSNSPCLAKVSTNALEKFIKIIFAKVFLVSNVRHPKQNL